ncbi:MAG: ABC transporter ATP-binding protein [bacterium]|nr:ABC transporter ATP-binding protein [bacterium]
MPAKKDLVRRLSALRRRGGHFAESEHAEEVGRTLKRIWRYLSREKLLLLGLIAVVLTGTAGNMYAPSQQSLCIDIIAGVHPGHLGQTLWLMLGGYALFCVCEIGQGMWSARLSQHIVEQLREELFGKIIDMPVSYLDRHSHGDVMSCMTNDIENISLSVSQAWPTLCSGLLTVIATSIIMVCYCWQLALLSAVAVVFTLVATKILAKFVRRYARCRQQLLGELNGAIEEMIYGYQTVVVCAHEEQTVKEFCSTADALTNAGISTEIFSGLLGPVMFITRNLNFVIIAACGGYFALKGLVTVGEISAFIVYSKMFSRPINEIAQIYGQLQTAVAGAERVFKVLDQCSERMEGEELKIKKGADIAFNNVQFSYKVGTPVIKDFSLRVSAGRRIALVGATGSGKTTIANLLLRFYDLDRGSITINGRNIARISRSSLRRHIAIVLQDTVLFSDTVERNLRYGREEAGRKRIEAAVNMSCAADIIQGLPQGYDTVLRGGGFDLSQGQRQLLAIARALIADPHIIILDEATSNVDTRTEKAVQESMQRLMRKRTCLIIAHRLSTIRDADMIVVMDNGQIAEQGTHEQLLERRGKYYELYMTQFAGIAT